MAAGESAQHGAPCGQEIAEFGLGKFDAELRALAHQICRAFGRIVWRELRQCFGAAVAALVQAKQHSRGDFDGRGSQAQLGAAIEVFQEGVQRLIQDFVGGLGRRTYPRPGWYPAWPFSSSMSLPSRASSTSPATAERSSSDMSETA